MRSRHLVATGLVNQVVVQRRPDASLALDELMAELQARDVEDGDSGALT